MHSDSPVLKERLAEAARYALMRRLLPAIRHNIAGLLQPIGMMSAILERRLKAPTPDMAQLDKSTQALHSLSREAAASSQNLMAWLGPKDNEPVGVAAAIDESLGLMMTELSFRGFSVANETAALQMQLPKGVLRSVFTASLIALTDNVQGAAKVVVTAAMGEGGAQVTIALEPGGSPEMADFGSHSKIYRVLDWDDVELLAHAEGVSLSHNERCVQLRYSIPA